MILLKKDSDTNYIQSLNLVFGFFPISFILGNLIININLVLFCCLGIFYLRSKILKTKFHLPLKIILLFFILAFFLTALSFIKSLYFEGYENNSFNRLIKSILFFRFFIMLLIVYLLSELDIINFKYFFLSAFFSSFLISIDVIYQYFIGFNIIGLESFGSHNTSFFGNEVIAGGFIQNFSFFAILFLSYLLRNNNNYFRTVLITIAVCTLALGIIVSGNRMPFILFLFGLFLVFLFNKKIRITVLASFLIVFITLEFLILFDDTMKKKYSSFYSQTKSLAVNVFERVKSDPSQTMLKEKTDFLKENPESVGHRRIFFTAIETWKLHRIFGNGIKSFREDCQRVMTEQKRGACSNHPHNYYLEILTDLGIVGFVSAITIILMFIIFLVKNYRIFNGNNIENLFLLAAVLSLFLEIFPIKSTGSIFTTNNATYTILLSGIILSHKKLLKGKNFR